MTTRLPIEAPPPEALLWDVVEEHFDEVEFLLTVCVGDYNLPNANREQLERTTVARLVAHVDALILSGDGVVDRLVRPALDEAESPERLMAAALMCFELPAEGLIVELFGRVADNPALADAVVEASAWATRAKVVGALPELRRTSALHALVLRVVARLGLEPGAELEPGIASADPVVSAAALVAVRFSREPDRETHLAFAEANLTSKEPAVALAALDTALAWRSEKAWRALVRLAEAGDSAALVRLAGLGTQADCQKIIAHCEKPELRAEALRALGYSGWISAAEACVPFFGNDDVRVARLAGEAFAAITGLPTTGVYWRKAPEVVEPDEDVLPPLEEDLARDLMPSVDEMLPVPDPDVIGLWWSRAKPLFRDDTRYLIGIECDEETARWAVAEGAPLRRVTQLDVLFGIRLQGRGWLPTRGTPAPLRQLVGALPSKRPVSFQAGLTLATFKAARRGPNE
ncbi:MAG: hypothetical protein JNG84_15380 [Archangium sp.]|nr:hypothetical protein [Archangium sp.]